MKFRSLKLSSLVSLSIIFMAGAPSVALAATASTTPKSTSPSASTKTSAADQQRISTLKSRGDAEIQRRLTTLNKLNDVINGTQKLSSTNKTSLQKQITDEVSSLNSLKTKLDADTDVTTTTADVQSIVTNYRVYALIVPKVYLLKTADTELVNNDKLSTLAGKLQSRINSVKTSSNTNDTTNLTNTLLDMNSKIAAAKSLATTIDNQVAPLQPTDYNSDHSLLSGMRDQLKTAHQDNQDAYNDAKAIVADLKSLPTSSSSTTTPATPPASH